MKAIFLIFCSLFLLFALPKVFSLTDEAESDEYTVTFAAISTGSGVHSANFTLPKPIYRNALTAVQAVSSNLTGSDVPSVSSYNTVSHLVVINGLDESLTRTISFTYLIESETIEDFMLTVISLLRWLYLFIVLGTAVGAIYCFFTS